jgi:hypothetical protein
MLVSWCRCADRSTWVVSRIAVDVKRRYTWEWTYKKSIVSVMFPDRQRTWCLVFGINTSAIHSGCQSVIYEKKGLILWGLENYSSLSIRTKREALIPCPRLCWKRCSGLRSLKTMLGLSPQASEQPQRRDWGWDCHLSRWIGWRNVCGKGQR